jgi:hypothetical protein
MAVADRGEEEKEKKKKRKEGKEREAVTTRGLLLLRGRKRVEKRA